MKYAYDMLGVLGEHYGGGYSADTPEFSASIKRQLSNRWQLRAKERNMGSALRSIEANRWLSNTYQQQVYASPSQAREGDIRAFYNNEWVRGRGVAAASRSTIIGEPASSANRRGLSTSMRPPYVSGVGGGIGGKTSVVNSPAESATKHEFRRLADVLQVGKTTRLKGKLLDGVWTEEVGSKTVRTAVVSLVNTANMIGTTVFGSIWSLSKGLPDTTLTNLRGVWAGIMGGNYLLGASSVGDVGSIIDRSTRELLKLKGTTPGLVKKFGTGIGLSMYEMGVGRPGYMFAAASLGLIAGGPIGFLGGLGVATTLGLVKAGVFSKTVANLGSDIRLYGGLEELAYRSNVREKYVLRGVAMNKGAREATYGVMQGMLPGLAPPKAESAVRIAVGEIFGNQHDLPSVSSIKRGLESRAILSPFNIRAPGGGISVNEAEQLLKTTKWPEYRRTYSSPMEAHQQDVQAFYREEMLRGRGVAGASESVIIGEPASSANRRGLGVSARPSYVRGFGGSAVRAETKLSEALINKDLIKIRSALTYNPNQLREGFFNNLGYILGSGFKPLTYGTSFFSSAEKQAVLSQLSKEEIRKMGSYGTKVGATFLNLKKGVAMTWEHGFKRAGYEPDPTIRELLQYWKIKKNVNHLKKAGVATQEVLELEKTLDSIAGGSLKGMGGALNMVLPLVNMAFLPTFLRTEEGEDVYRTSGSVIAFEASFMLFGAAPIKLGASLGKFVGEFGGHTLGHGIYAGLRGIGRAGKGMGWGLSKTGRASTTIFGIEGTEGAATLLGKGTRAATYGARMFLREGLGALGGAALGLAGGIVGAIAPDLPFIYMDIARSVAKEETMMREYNAFVGENPNYQLTSPMAASALATERERAAMFAKQAGMDFRSAMGDEATLYHM